MRPRRLGCMTCCSEAEGSSFCWDRRSRRFSATGLPSIYPQPDNSSRLVCEGSARLGTIASTRGSMPIRLYGRSRGTSEPVC